MKKDFIDEHGVKWIAPAEVASIWNERARASGIEARYTRWSVYQRRDDIPFLDTPLGRLYREDKVKTAPLRPRSNKRLDTTERNRRRKTEQDENSPCDAHGKFRRRKTQPLAVA